MYESNSPGLTATVFFVVERELLRLTVTSSSGSGAHRPRRDPVQGDPVAALRVLDIVITADLIGRYRLRLDVDLHIFDRPGDFLAVRNP